MNASDKIANASDKSANASDKSANASDKSTNASNGQLGPGARETGDIRKVVQKMEETRNVRDHLNLQKVSWHPLSVTLWTFSVPGPYVSMLHNFPDIMQYG